MATIARRGLKSIPETYSIIRTGSARRFAVLTKRETLDAVDLTKTKVQKVISLEERKLNPAKIKVPIQASWEQNQKIIVRHRPSNLQTSSNEPIDLCFGGLPALMAAAKLKTNHPDRKVVYVTNGMLSKSEQSGHQAHNHPSEFVAEDCNKRNLLLAMVRGMGILPNPDPTDVKRYTYLHFPNVLKQFADNPIENLRLYGAFFAQRILHDITARNGVSIQDRWLCRTIEKSLDFHEALSDKIFAKTGLKTLKRNFRVYWSPDHAGIKKKEACWKELEIPCEMIPAQDLVKHTLLRLDQNLAVLKIHRDGQFEPETPKRVMEYFQGEYPDSFLVEKAQVNEIYINTDNQPEAVKITQPDGKEKNVLVRSVFGTPGHDQVYRLDPATHKEKQLWKSVGVSGISSLWVCTISRKELENRWNIGNEDALKQHLENLCPAANLCNLHVTVFDHEVRSDSVRLYVRVSQGANFNSTVADKSDLINISTNLDRFFIGNWELVSAGTCTRQTGVTNVPTITDMFGYDYSGVGYSASVPPDRDDPKPALFD